MTLRANNRRRRSAAVLSVDHRTAAVLQRTESLIRWNGGAQLVVVAGIFRLFRRLDLEQIGRVDLAAVGADLALAEQRIVGRKLFHLGDHGLAVGVAFERVDRLQIMCNR